MHINSLPAEVFHCILLHLKDEPILPMAGEEVPSPAKENGDQDAWYHALHLGRARLVCKLWDQVARELLFTTIALTQDGQDGDPFLNWNDMLDTDFIRPSVRCAIIHSATEALWDRDFGSWETWAEDDGHGHGDWKEFTDSISRVSELKAMTSLVIRFSDGCCSPSREPQDFEYVELSSTRRHLLQAIFEAIQARAAQQDAALLRSLYIENLQNISLRDFTSSALFREVVGNLNELHLMIAEEGEDGGLENYLICDEHWQFEPVLRQEWLMPVAEYIRSLSLYFDEKWGIIPDYFCGANKQVIFPQLRELRLGRFVIGHPDQLDWIYKSTDLRSLHLEECHIASYIEITDDPELSGKSVIDTKDWKRMPEGSVQSSHQNAIFYYFPLTWQTIFDRIRTELALLDDFRFHYDHSRYVQSCFRRPQLMRTDPGQLYGRYGVVSNGTIPTYLGKLVDMGKLYFKDASGVPLNRHLETLEGDQESLMALLDACRGRLKA